MALKSSTILFLVVRSVLALDDIDLIKLKNETVIKLNNDNDGFKINARINVMELWDRLSKPTVLRNVTREQCRRESEIYLNSLDRLELWALKMFDATAKVPAGILSGNGNQFGDFDECLNIDGAIKGKYCLASLQVDLNGHENMKVIDTLIHSGHAIRSNLTDPILLLPRYSSLLWGVCIPSSCNSFDLEKELSQRLSDLRISVRVHNTMCSIKNYKRSYYLGKALSVTFFIMIILLLCLGTIIDDGKTGTTTFMQLLNAFSIRRNLRTMFTFTDSPSNIKGADFWRVINMLALLAVHKILVLLHMIFVNKVYYSEILHMPWVVVGRAVVLYTESFLYLSGLLNAYSLLQDLERKSSKKIKERLITRWFRLFPTLGSLILFCTYILPDINQGPQWNTVIKGFRRICQKNMWKNVLFIQNYSDSDKMCQLHTHHIGTDMQLYVVTVFIITLIWKKHNLGIFLLGTLIVSSTVLRYLATYWYNISTFVYSQISVQKLLEVGHHSYFLPTHRATIYFMGVLMAYLMKSKKLNYTLSKIQVALLWLFCIILGTLTLISPYKMGQEGYQYEPFSAAVYSAFSPILWGLLQCVLHWAICNDYAGKCVPFIESRVFKFFNKIAYSVYLVQIPIFFYSAGIQRNPEYFSLLRIFNLPEIVAIIIISIMTTLAIEMPFNNVYKIYFGQTQKTLKDK